MNKFEKKYLNRVKDPVQKWLTFYQMFFFLRSDYPANQTLELKNQKNILPWTRLVRLISMQTKEY